MIHSLDFFSLQIHRVVSCLPSQEGKAAARTRQRVRLTPHRSIRGIVTLPPPAGRRTTQAIQYARDHLSPHAASHGVEIQRAMATLAFPDPAAAPVPEYAALFADDR